MSQNRVKNNRVKELIHVKQVTSVWAAAGTGDLLVITVIIIATHISSTGYY